MLIREQRGLTLIELMVDITIGTILLLGLGTVFFNSSRAYRELDRAGQMLENGRYALTLLTEDLRHAGFYGEFFSINYDDVLYDPCYTGNDPTVFKNTMQRPIQGYNAPDSASRPDISATSCGGLLPDDNLSPGSDILVIRRAATALSNGASADEEIYLQTNGRQFDIRIGDGSAVPYAGMLKYPESASHTDLANTRKYTVHVYFVAPCSIGTGGDGVCTADDGDPDINPENAVPTLKRLELAAVYDGKKCELGDTGCTTEMLIVPLVEGIEYFQVEYGIDNLPNTIATSEYGDGLPDLYVAAPTTAQRLHTIAMRIHLLSRTIKSGDRRESLDDKTYVLAGVNFGPFGDPFKRHVYSTEIRPVNLAGRREIPK